MKLHSIEYFNQIRNIGASGTEHNYRTCFENLLNHIKADERIRIIHEPKRKKGFGAPDFRVEKDGAIVGYIETKKPGEDLEKISKSEQIKKYLNICDNFILTDYCRFMLFKSGELMPDHCGLFDIADSERKNAVLQDENISRTGRLFSNFFMSSPVQIRDSHGLAVHLAQRAKILKEYISDILHEKENYDFSDKIQGLYENFQETLVKDLSAEEFADAYAQTVIYGFFLARLQSDENISLHDAGRFVPLSFKVIKEFFSFISYDYSIPNHVLWIFNEIISLINNIDLTGISGSLSFQTAENRTADPYIYFYETFLGQFDPEKRKSKGVYYTPPEVVGFIVRSVEKILSDAFSKAAGFADSSVTVLDFATGTGTFLVEIFRLMLDRADRGDLSSVIRNHILKNFYGFEYLVAPYAVAHLKLSQLLKDYGYVMSDNERLQVYLTDTLDDTRYKQIKTFPAISEEGNKANEIKVRTPILVITGNPPYNNRSTGQRIESLINDYKPKNEKKLNLNDDYIKFIRFAHDRIENNKHGVIGIITNNSFLSGLTHRRMRETLMRDFDEIYILNLHGSSRIGEQSPDGSVDENVFDIMQGVAISIFVKKPDREKTCRVFYQDLYGKREDKHVFLSSHDVNSVKWKELKIESFDKAFKKTRWGKQRFSENLCFFVPTGTAKIMKNYGKFWGITEIFETYGSGMKTDRDSVTVKFTHQEIQKIVKDFEKLSEDELKKMYDVHDSRDWKISKAKEDILLNKNNDLFHQIHYRPFDVRWTFYSGKSRGFMGTPGYNIAKHFLVEKNLGLVFPRICKNKLFDYGQITDKLTDVALGGKNTGSETYVAPLYIHNGNTDRAKEDLFINGNGQEKIANFTPEFTRFISSLYPKRPSAKEILGYIYAIMYCPSYRQTYLECLKIDFPRIPFTENYEIFQSVSEIGTELIAHHLMKKSYPDNRVSFPEPGSDTVETIRFVCDKNSGNVFINKNQYFSDVPAESWEFHIGGYQVLDKWLKSRKDRILSYQEKEHFKKTVNILKVTTEYMNNIDKLWQGHFETES